MSQHTQPAAVVPGLRWLRAVLIAGAALTGVVALLPWLPGTGGVRPAWLETLYPVLILAAPLLPAWSAAHDRRIPAAHRRAWVFVIGSIAMMALAQAVWHLQGQPVLSVIDLLYLVAYAGFVAGIASLPSALRDRDRRFVAWTDAMLVAVAGYTLLWSIYLGPRAEELATPLATMISTLWPVGDLLILFTAVALLLRPQPIAIRQAAVWISVAAALQFAGNIVYIGSGFASALHRFGWAEILWGSANVALGYAAFRHRRRAVDPRIAAPRWFTERSYQVVPLFSLGLASVLLLWMLATRWDNLSMGLAVGAVLLIAVAVFRERHTARHNTRLQLEAAQRKSEARFRALVQNASDIIAVTDRQGLLTFVTPSSRRILGHPPEELQGRRLADLLHPDDHQTAATFLRTLDPTTPTPSGAGVCRVRHRDGSWRHIEVAGTDLSADPEIGGFVLNARDVTERVELERLLSHQAKHDALTGLPNRRLLSERMERCIRATPGATSVAVLYLDLDGFKQVNDTLGHEAGDALLTLTAQRLLSATRGSDVVARLGGDEFTVLLCGVRSRSEIVIVAERIRDSLARPFELGATEATVAASIGIAWERVAAHSDQLLRDADLAMYHAKQAGGGRYVFHEDLRLDATAVHRNPAEPFAGSVSHGERRPTDPPEPLPAGRVHA